MFWQTIATLESGSHSGISSIKFHSIFFSFSLRSPVMCIVLHDVMYLSAALIKLQKFASAVSEETRHP